MSLRRGHFHVLAHLVIDLVIGLPQFYLVPLRIHDVDELAVIIYLHGIGDGHSLRFLGSN